MDADKTVTAHFTQNEYTLTVLISPAGADTAGCTVDRDIAGPYNYNDVVQLTSNAVAGWTFSHWTGDLTGSTDPDNVTMDADKAVTAHFEEVHLPEFENGICSSAYDVDALSIDVPDDVAAGDFLIAHIACQPSDKGLNAPVGWTLIDDSGETNDVVRQAIYYRVADGTEVDFTWETNDIVATFAGCIIHFTGVNTANPIFDVTLNDGDSSVLTATEIESAPAGSMVLAFYAFKQGCLETSLQVPTDMEVASYNCVGGGSTHEDLQILSAYQLMAGGGDTEDKVSNSSAGDSKNWVAHLLVLLPE